MRSDLPHGMQVAQTIHAAGETVTQPLPDGTYAIALQVPDELALLAVGEKLRRYGVAHKVITETDGPFAGQAMAIGVVPTADRALVRKATSSLPTVK